jgi:hypothetical protein
MAFLERNPKDAAHAADTARDTGQIKSILAKAKRPSETEAAFSRARGAMEISQLRIGWWR